MARVAFKPVRGYGVHVLPIESGPEAATQTFVKGAVLVNSSGYLAEGGANPTGILGVALEDGNNDAAAGTSDINFAMATTSTVFEGTVDTNAALGTGAIAAADLYAEYGITEDSSGVWYVDKAKTGANGRVRVVALKDDVATVNGRVHFVFVSDGTALGVT